MLTMLFYFFNNAKHTTAVAGTADFIDAFYVKTNFLSIFSTYGEVALQRPTKADHRP